MKRIPIIPQVDYNRVLARGKHAVRRDGGIESDVMTARKALGIYKVSQEMNFIRNPELCLKKPAYGQRRHWLI